MRDKQFIIDSIKMDLLRIVTAVGNIQKPIPRESVQEFLTHALKDFDKTELTERELMLKKQVQNLNNILPELKDSPTRLRWAEDALTIRCRL